MKPPQVVAPASRYQYHEGANQALEPVGGQIVENAPRSTERRHLSTKPARALAVLMTIALVAAVVLLINSAAAATIVEIPITTVLRGNPGEVFSIDTVPAAAGDQCTAELEGHNNESIHPDSDILVGPITFADVEDGAFAAAGLAFTATGPVDVAVRLGADGVFSAGFLLEVTCNPPTTTTTSPTTESPSTTTTTATQVTTTTSVLPAPPTTLSPPPVGGIDTGYGSCADGACDGSLSPLTTWLLLGGALAGVTALGLLVIIGGQRKQDPPYE